jgi:hypothetical protein
MALINPYKLLITRRNGYFKSIHYVNSLTPIFYQNAKITEGVKSILNFSISIH